LFSPKVLLNLRRFRAVTYLLEVLRFHQVNHCRASPRDCGSRIPPTYAARTAFACTIVRHLDAFAPNRPKHADLRANRAQKRRWALPGDSIRLSAYHWVDRRTDIPIEARSCKRMLADPA